MAVRLPGPLDGIRDYAIGRTFPRSVLQGWETGLCLFAAGFLGRQDAVWLADAGLRVTCVDTDAAKLAEMEGMYPEDWQFVCEDVFAFVWEADRTWDIVTVDCPSNMFLEAAEFLPQFCELAERAVVLGSDNSATNAPPGWVVTEKRKRSDYVPGGVFWSVLEPA